MADEKEEKRNWLGPYIPQGSAWRELVQQIKLVYNLLLDARVPALTKLIPFGALAYLFFPADFAPDIVPVLGQLDDLAVLMLGLRFFVEFAPPEVVREHLKRLAGAGNWEVVKDPPAAPQSPAGAEGQIVESKFKDEGQPPA